MNRKHFQWLCVGLLGLALSSCSLLGGDKEPSFQISDLYGYWQEDNTEHFVRFTTEQSTTEGYCYGYEWDDAEWNDEGSFEDFLLEQRAKQGYPGNGWFEYLFETSGSLMEIHFMDNGGADIPMPYVVTKLTDTELAYYDKRHPSTKYTFTKVVSPK